MRKPSPLSWIVAAFIFIGAVLIAARQTAAQTTSLTTLHWFVTNEGILPYYGLTAGADDTLYGTCFGIPENVGPGGSVFKIRPDGSDFTVLHTFYPITNNSVYNVGGANPQNGPIIGEDGRLYGITGEGGTGAYGVLYALDTNGDDFTVLNQFNVTNGEYQYAGIIQGGDHYLYGIRESNGTNDSQIYKVDTNGNNYADIHVFAPNAGGNIYYPLLSGRDGSLYGATWGDWYDGSIFKLTTNGTYTDLHDFSGPDGASGYGNLIEDSASQLYGVAALGGSNDAGVVFRIAADGSNYTVLHHFGAGNDGQYPAGGLLLASDGNIYGATLEGGADGYGIIFRMDPNGANYAVLYSFTGDFSSSGDHGYPNGSLVETRSRQILGMTGDTDFYGDTFGNGTIFSLGSIAPAGTGVTAINSASLSPTNSSSVQWTVTFQDPVTGLTGTNFQLLATGLDGPPAITSVAGSGTNWIVTASAGSGTGTLQLNLTNVTSISPPITNTLPVLGQSYSIDTVPPATVISSPSVSLTNTGPVSFIVTWADPNLDASSISLSPAQVTVNTTGAVSVGSVQVLGDGNTRTVSLNSITGDGTVGISIPSGSAFDTAGNPSEAAGPSSTALIDNTAPSISSSGPTPAATTNGPTASVSYTITYADAHFGASTLTADDISLANPAISADVSVVQNNATNFTVTLSDFVGVGSQAVDIAPGTATDLAGNIAPAFGPSAAFAVFNPSSPPPLITAQPTNLTVAFGSNAVFAVAVSNASPVSYQWMFGGTNIDSATNAALTLTNVTFGLAGSYSVLVAATNGSATSESAILTVTQASAAVSLSGLAQVYTGSALTVTPTTDPPSLRVDLTYNGSTNAPTNAGSYTVIATVNDPDYTGSVTNTFFINKAEANVTFNGLSQTYDGTAKSVTAVTVPVGLAVNLTYDGLSSAPTNAGTYAVVALVTDLNHFGGATNSLVVSNAQLTATADNKSKYVNQPNPALSGSLQGAVPADGLSLSFNTTASLTSPAGAYPITPVINDPGNRLGNYTVVYSDGVLTVTLGAPTITLNTNTVIYTLQQPPAFLASNARFTALSSPTFNGGHLNALIVSNQGPFDLLGLAATGSGTNQISADAGSISYGGLTMATFTGGTTNDPGLQFTFNTNTTSAAIQALVGALDFAVEAPDVTNVSRTIQLTLDDGNSLTSAPVTVDLEINHQPQALPFPITTGSNLPVTITFSQLLTNCSDVDGDILSIASIPTNSLAGGLVTTNVISLTYNPPASYLGTDTISYLISDGRGGTNTGVLNVTVVTGNSVFLEGSLTNLTGSNKVATLELQGLPGRTYRVQASTDLHVWTTIGTFTVPEDGIADFSDTNAFNYPARYYRTVYP